jgi:hypothetical protein
MVMFSATKLIIEDTEFYIVAKNKTKHTLRLTPDIYNFTNLLNKDWGYTRDPAQVREQRYKISEL